MAILTRLHVPGDGSAWTSLGFELDGNSFQVGRTKFTCAAESASWDFDHIREEPGRLGVPTGQTPAPSETAIHPNGIDRVDHVVYAVGDLDEAVEALTDVLAMPPTRRSHPRGPDGPEMAFYRAGEGFIEVVASGRPAALWGIAFSTPDLDSCVAAVRAAGGPIGEPKPAVQGGRIASVWKEHTGWGVAVMEPRRTG